jgi:hypothetical protein
MTPKIVVSMSVSKYRHEKSLVSVSDFLTSKIVVSVSVPEGLGVGFSYTYTDTTTFGVGVKTKFNSLGPGNTLDSFKIRIRCD